MRTETQAYGHLTAHYGNKPSKQRTILCYQTDASWHRRLYGDVRGDGMQGFTRWALYLGPSLLVICVLLLGGLCVAQDEDIETPAAPAAPDLRFLPGSVFAPGVFLGLIAPVQDRIDLNLYGFFYFTSTDFGEVKVPVVMVDVPIRTTKFLTITPSYLYYQIRLPSELIKASGLPEGVPDTFEEHQFRIDGTLKFSIHKFEISDRNMYVRRFRPTDDINRYRNRIAITHPWRVKGRIWRPFANYEAFYEWRNGGWNKNRVGVGVTLPLRKGVLFQPSYLWENNKVGPDITYLQFGVIFSTKSK
jgi:hypothetical protein